eukprot:2121785-Pleurochrysis_carterae.AAC.3
MRVAYRNAREEDPLEEIEEGEQERQQREQHELEQQRIGQLVEKTVAGEIPVHALETQLSDCDLAVRVRRGWLTQNTNKSLSGLPMQGFDYKSVHGVCAEMVVGYVPLPVGVAGPLLLNGKQYQVPLATVEGALIASTRRGCKAISESGGASARVTKQGMTRAPVLLFPSAMRACDFQEWIESADNLPRVQEKFASTSRFGRLQSVKVAVAGKQAYARFCCATGDAMGMNMVSKGVNAVLDDLIANEFPDMQARTPQLAHAAHSRLEF